MNTRRNGMETRFKSWDSESPGGKFLGPYHASDLMKYMSCPRKVFFSRVAPTEGGKNINEYLLCGTVFHNLVEMWHNAAFSGQDDFLWKQSLGANYRAVYGRSRNSYACSFNC